jgi:hypothetical protein
VVPATGGKFLIEKVFPGGSGSVRSFQVGPHKIEMVLEKKAGSGPDTAKAGDANLKAIRKALEKLAGVPGADVEEIRKEILKALEQMQKPQAGGEGAASSSALHKQLFQLLQEQQKMLETRGPNHPDVKALQKRFEMLPQLMEQARAQAEAQKQHAEQQKHLATAAARLRALAEKSEKKGPSARLGIQVEKPGDALADQLNLPSGRGLLIVNVLPDSPAAKGGIKANDVLLELAGKAVSNDPMELVKMIEGIKTNNPVDLLVLRKGKRETVKGVALRDALAASAGKRAIAVNVPLPAPGVAFQGAMGGARAAGGGDAVMTTTFRTGDRFTTRYQEGTLIITVVGEGNQVREITVQDGAVTNKYDRVESVPGRYRDKVNHLVETSTRGSVRIERK